MISGDSLARKRHGTPVRLGLSPRLRAGQKVLGASVGVSCPFETSACLFYGVILFVFGSDFESQRHGHAFPNHLPVARGSAIYKLLNGRRVSRYFS